jgi:predicted PurR-regulated permease PerM
VSRERQVVYWTLVLAVFVALLIALREILLPFVAGMAIAYFLDPVADRLQKWGLSRTLSASVLTIVFLLVVAAFLMVLVPILQSQALDFVSRLPQYVELLRSTAVDLLALVQARLSPEDLARLRDAVGGLAGGAVAWFGRVATQIWSGGLALINLLSLIIITPIVAFYLLRDWDDIVTRLDSWLPRRHRATIREQLAEIDKTLAGFARGQAIVCIGLGIFYGVGLTVVGLEFGLIVGLVTGLISFVPFFGMLTGLAVGLGLAFAQFDSWLPIAMVAGVFGIGQVIEGNFVTPKLVGDRVGLHPVWMIFALLAGGTLFGFVGVLLSVPAAATVGVLMRFGLSRYLAGALFDDGAGRDDAEADQSDRGS